MRHLGRRRRAAAGQQYALVVGLVAAVALLAVANAGTAGGVIMDRIACTLTGVAINGIAGCPGTSNGSSGGGGSGGGGPAPVTNNMRIWGNNSYGQMGKGDQNTPAFATTFAPGYGGTAVATGYYTGFFIDSAGKAWGTGKNNYLDLGIGPGGPTYPSSPIAVANGGGYIGNNMAKIFGGQDTNCGLLAGGGKAVCWGEGSAGELGDNNGASSNIPVSWPMAALTTATI